MLIEDVEKLSLDKAYKKVDLCTISPSDIGSALETFGWVERVRTQGRMTFIDLYAGFKTLKCVARSRKEHKGLTQWSSVRVFGQVNKNMNEGRDKHMFELFVEKLEIVSIAPAFPINSETKPCTMLDLGHLALRTPERAFFLRAHSHLLRVIRDFFYSRGFVEITPPTIVKTQTEGGSTLFRMKYYDEDAYLTQSSQLYLETVVPVCHRAFCIMPSYRAEKSNTPRHLSEYAHVEGEMADIGFEDLICLCEELILHTMSTFYKDMHDDIEELYPGFLFHTVPKKMKRMKYAEAIEHLSRRGQVKADGTLYSMGDDISSAAEKFLCDEFGGPVILHNFLAAHKPFYMKKDASCRDETESIDILFPGVGEILGGSMRCDNYEELLEGFKREGIDPAPYYWYTDMLKYGAFSHGGFGIGFERLLAGMLRWKSVNKARLYPRFTTRCMP